MKQLNFNKFDNYSEGNNAIKIVNEIGRILRMTESTFNEMSYVEAINRMKEIYDLFRAEEKKEDGE